AAGVAVRARVGEGADGPHALDAERLPAVTTDGEAAAEQCHLGIVPGVGVPLTIDGEALLGGLKGGGVDQRRDGAVGEPYPLLAWAHPRHLLAVLLAGDALCSPRERLAEVRAVMEQAMQHGTAPFGHAAGREV